MHLVRRHRWIEIEQRSDVATHGYLALRNETCAGPRSSRGRLPQMALPSGRFAKWHEISQRRIAQVQASHKNAPRYVGKQDVRKQRIAVPHMRGDGAAEIARQGSH